MKTMNESQEERARKDGFAFFGISILTGILLVIAHWRGVLP